MNHNLDERDWRDVVRRLKKMKCAPLISNQVIRDQLFEGLEVTREWATEIGYPLDDKGNLTRVAQYWKITLNDASRAKDEYLDFLKESLLRSVEGKRPDHVLKAVRDEQDELTVSQLAARLDLLDFATEPGTPLRILAELPIKIYLTSSYHDFIEEALRAAEKKPHSETCCWKEDLEEDPDIAEDNDPDFEPSVEAPLVYHLHGRDKFPGSMVLSEDDYLDFLVTVSQEADKIIAGSVNIALSDSLLLLLGYNLRYWDFRVLLRGLIHARPAGRRPQSYSIQMPPDDGNANHVERVQKYLQEYFKGHKFAVYWGDVQTFANDLWAQWGR